jgi:starch phosphorylase
MPGHQYILDVHPNVPDELARMDELANNLWYSWDRPTRALFGPLNPRLWDQVGHNPKLFLRRIDEEDLRAAARDPVYLANYRKVLSAYDTYHGDSTRWGPTAELGDGDLVAYFCAEFGLHESLHIYSGGLGILAGHHCKTASDMRVPFVAVGLMYRAGYFTQRIDGEGNQIATYVESDVHNLPVHSARDPSGKELYLELNLVNRPVIVKVWEVRVGHVTLYLLDTAVDANPPEERQITYQLYGGDRETRIKQEIILGEGGVRALRALDVRPAIWHCNEGHPAFLMLERVREMVQAGSDFHTALEAVAASTVFTTHTPVPAGHDEFDESLAMFYFEPLVRQLGIEAQELLSLGRFHDGGHAHAFNMTTLAIAGSRHHNGVSRIHGDVSSKLCGKSWVQVPPEENPMRFVTNGVHIPTVLSQDWCDLLDRSFGTDWRNHLSDYEYWQRLLDVPDHLFWSVKQSIKSKMLHAVNAALVEQHLRNQVSEPHLDRIRKFIDPSDPNVLTIGFARRFATYKRATLLFNDLDWLRELLGDAERPVVFIFAGKAHPADEPGQAHLKIVHEMTQMPEFVGKILLVEGYDLALARRMVAGMDVWLNNPVFPLEASGTSGMKAAVNGTINLSVTDGWWGEGFEGDNGWAIKPSPHSEDEARRDAEDARTLYEILQDDVIPLYYDRGKYGYSPGWVHMAKRSMASVVPRFNMRRALSEYIHDFYVPAARQGRRLAADDHAGARTLALWKKRVRKAWPKVSLRRLDNPIPQIRYGEQLSFEVAAQLNGLEPQDVMVELLVSRRHESKEAIVGGILEGRRRPPGWVSDKQRPYDARAQFTAVQKLDGGGAHRYRLDLEPEWCGRLSYQIRMYPYHELLTHPFELGLMVWL